MMRAVISNFQSIGSTTIEPTGLTVIVGPSDRGKSALLRAVEAALFNRSGKQFIRTGATQAAVELELPEPGAAGVHRIRWEKGGGVNRFTVDGTDYSRVGRGAPDALAAIGFQDVLIGAKLRDDGKLEGGETVRPQVAHQFDPIFLLLKSGAFLNEVLLGLSRLNVLQRAGRLCAGDLRSARTLLKDTETALAAAQQRVDRLAEAPALAARVTTLTARVEAVGKREALAERLRGLARGRTMAQDALARPTPPKAPPLPDTRRYDTLQGLVGQRKALQAAAAAATYPSPVFVPTGLGERVEQRAELARLVREQRQHRNWVEQYGFEVMAGTQTLQTLTTKLDALKAELKVCPTCERPF